MRILIALFCFVSIEALSQDGERSPRLVAHLLSYIQRDYPGAVEKGQIKKGAEGEYKEQIEFVDLAIKTNQELGETKAFPEIAKDLTRLKQLILDKKGSEQVGTLALSIVERVQKVSNIQTSPAKWPSLARGQKLYAQNCAQCHGDTGYGDGPSGTNLDPKPTNFHDGEILSQISPFQAFNTIRLGVPGTGMAAFPFSSEEIWDLAFYILSLRHGKTSPVEAPSLPLSEVASLSDAQLMERKLRGAESLKLAQVAHLRTKEMAGEGATQFIDVAMQKLGEARTLYGEGRADAAQHAAVIAYLDGVEPIEPRLRAKDPDFVMRLEAAMANVRRVIDSRGSQSDLVAGVESALETLREGRAMLETKVSSPWFTFSVASGIFLREAFEAILLLVTLLGIIRTLKSKRAAAFVHLGWGLALGVGVVLWFLSGWVMSMSGLQRELLEGGISVLAVVVLLYLGFWLHRKTEIGRWRAFLQEMVDTAVKGKSLAVLAGISFMAVFREAFETVLFLRALLLEAGPGQEAALYAGVGFSFIVVMILATFLVKFSARLPLKQLFSISSMVLIFLALILTGKAVHSFQEAGLLPISSLPWNLRSDLLGLYPTWETLLPQLGVLLIAGIAWLTGGNPKSSPRGRGSNA